MKNYKIRALFSFNDTAEKNQDGVDTPRKIGDVWNCTKERYEFLKNHNAVELVGIDEIKEPKLEAKVLDEIIEKPFVEKVIKEVKSPKKTTVKKKLTTKK